MKSRYLMIPLFAAIACSTALGQQPDQDRKWYTTLGVYFPSTQVPAPIRTYTGVSSSIGYVLSRKEGKMITIESLGGAFIAKDSTFSATANAGGFTLNSITLSKTGRTFYGLGLGFTMGRVSSGSTIVEDDTRLLYNFEFGQNLSRTTFIRARYQTSFDSPTKFYNGAAIEFGYRF